MTWLSQLFIHPAMAALGMGLISIPIVIHLINRLQYRKVRFAAMEFLLQSQQRNRRRVLFEQLLLLLLRILLVLILAAIFARLILDPSHLSLLEKSETHHIVVLDDSGSMQDRWGETSAFQEGLNVIKRLTSELSNQEGLQTFTLLNTSQPGRSLSSFTQRRIDVSMISELEDKLEAMPKECSFGRARWEETFSSLKRIVAAGDVQQQVVHIISDFRADEWKQSPSMPEQLKNLATENTIINLVPTVPDRHENLAVVSITGQLQSAAVQVPLPLTTEITNFGQFPAENISIRVLIDGEPIPQAITIPRIGPGETLKESFEVVFTTPGEHAVSVQIPPDALEADNVRRLALNVPDRQRVLIADGTEGFTEAQFVSDALSADSSITGIEVLIIRPENLRNQNLSQFTAVYLLNISSLPPDSVSALTDYVNRGGGIAWFLGNQVDGAFYRRLATTQQILEETSNSTSENSSQDRRLFPASIGQSPLELPRGDETTPGADLQLSSHPVFEFLNASEGLLAHFVNIYRYFPLSAEQTEQLPEDTQVIGRLRNQAPIFLESRLGNGRIFVSLTSSGPMENSTERRWHNWPFDLNAPGFTVFHLELVKYLGSRQGFRSELLIGDPLRLKLDPTSELPELRIDPPESAGVSAVLLQAAYPEKSAPSSDSQTSTPQESPIQLMQAEYAETTYPGIYRVTRENINRESVTQLYAINLPSAEGSLDLTTPAEMRTAFASIDRLLIQDLGELEGIQKSDPGRELRTLLLLLFLGVLLAEQALAYRLGYHDRSREGKFQRPDSRETARTTSRPQTSQPVSAGRTGR